MRLNFFEIWLVQLVNLTSFCCCYFCLVFCLFETNSHLAAHTGLDLTMSVKLTGNFLVVPLPRPPECWDYRKRPHAHFSNCFLYRSLNGS